MPIQESPNKKKNNQKYESSGGSDTSNSEMEIEEESKNQGNDFPHRRFELEEHIDCLDTVNHWLNAVIINIRENYIRVHYNGWSQKYDEWIEMNSPRILKQWVRGAEIQLNNRIDVLDDRNNWLEARVIDINKDRIKVHYYGYSSKFDEWVHLDSDRVAEVGSHSKAYGGAKYRKDCGKNEHREKMLKALRDEENFKIKLRQRGLGIKEIHGDGNCLFRAFSDQLYGHQDWHGMIRQVCMDYIETERDFYKNFIIGGGIRFDEYLARKRQDSVWGDDLEIQALSEIYNRSIEIYAYSSEPMRTFHEVNKNNQDPIRLSYHGASHYNSIKKIGQENDGLMDLQPGEVEDIALRNAKTREQIRSQNKGMNIIVPGKDNSGNLGEAIELSRAEFENKGRRDMEIALEESLASFYEQQAEKVVDQELEETIKASMDAFEEQKNEEELVRMIINQTKTEEEKLMEDDLKKALEESKKNAGMDYRTLEEHNQYPPGVKQVIDAGFQADLVLAAYSVVGDNPDLIISFIYENYM